MADKHKTKTITLDQNSTIGWKADDYEARTKGKRVVRVAKAPERKDGNQHDATNSGGPNAPKD